MGVNMRRKALILLSTVAILAGLAACAEKPQRMVSEGERFSNLDPGNPLAERTLNQGESRRIGS
jgi:hypothetical protein